jgi:hypothetical protein
MLFDILARLGAQVQVKSRDSPLERLTLVLDL